MGFGGNNGLTDFKDILGFNLQSTGTRATLFIATCLALFASLLLCLAITRSRLGAVLTAIRDARAGPVSSVIGSSFQALRLHGLRLHRRCCGALYVPQVGIINPGEFAPPIRSEAVIWTAIGGRGTLFGPILGAVLVNFAKSWFTSALPELWLFALGGFFLAVTLFLPKGLAGCSSNARPKKQNRPCRQRNLKPRSERWTRQRIRSSISDGVNVSFDGFKALNALSLIIEPGRIARRHRAEWRRQDHDDGCHHRKTRPDTGDVLFAETRDLTRLDEASDC